MPENNNSAAVKKKRRLNIIDFVLIIAIVGAIIGVATRFGIVDKVVDKAKSTDVCIAVKIEKIRTSTVKALEADIESKAVMYEEKKGLIGTVENIRSNDNAVYYVTRSDGTVEKTTSPDGVYCDVVIEIHGTGVFSDDGFKVNASQILMPGAFLNLTSQHIEVTGRVLSIEPYEN